MKICTKQWNFNMNDVKGIEKTNHPETGKLTSIKVYYEVRELETFPPEIVYTDEEEIKAILEGWEKFEW